MSLRSSACLLTLLVLLASGCSSTQPLRYTNLDSSTRLSQTAQERKSRMPYRYADRTDRSRYELAYLPAVEVYDGPDAQFEKIGPQDRRLLADYMHQAFEEELAKAFVMTDAAEPGALRIQLTLTGAKPSKKFLAAASRFDMGGAPYNLVQSIRGKEGAMSGSVMYAVEVYDASSGKLLEAYVSKQYPNAMNVKANIGALSASKVGIQRGAQDLVALLAKSRAR
jgi:hypothetical protein